MKGIKRYIGVLLIALVIVPMLLPSVVYGATNKSLASLERQVIYGRTKDILLTSDDLYVSYVSNEDGVIKTYNKSGGGYYLWAELINERNDTTTGYVSQEKFNELTPKGRREFLSDIMRICNNLVAYHAKQNNTEEGESRITTETANLYIERLQNLDNAGSQLMASLMAETKPDYVTANRIYKPFSGVVGTVLAFISILIMALLGVTMANDLAYIVIPVWQCVLDGDSDGGGAQSGAAKGMAKIVSPEARNAVKTADGSGGANGQSGSSNKLAVTVYLKSRWKSLVVLGICLLYLIQGQIYSFVAWVLDLVSGFVGF